MVEVLPSSNMRVPTRTVFVHGVECERLFCPDCGIEAPFVAPCEVLGQPGTFNCWLCEPCAAKRPVDPLRWQMPDEIFRDLAVAEMIDREGRVLTGEEQARALDDPTHYLSKLAKDRPRTR